MKRLVALYSLLLLGWPPYSIRCWLLQAPPVGVWTSWMFARMNQVVVGLGLLGIAGLLMLNYLLIQRSLAWLSLVLIVAFAVFAHSMAVIALGNPASSLFVDALAIGWSYMALWQNGRLLKRSYF